MKKQIYLDTEFNEYHKQPKVLGFNVGRPIPTVDLISIGLVDDNGAEYYAICNEFDFEDAWEDTWLRENVLWGIYVDFLQRFEGKSFAHSMDEYDRLELSKVKAVFKTYGKSKAVIAKEIIEFVKAEESDVEFIAYFASYDWVVTAQLFGTMLNLPKGFPMYCIDIQQMIDENGIDKKELKRQVPQANSHNALDDARWNKKAHTYIVKTLVNNSDKTVPNLEDNGDKEETPPEKKFSQMVNRPSINLKVVEDSVPAQDIADVDGNVWVDERDNKSYVPGTDQIVSFDSINADTSSDVSYDSCND